MIANYFVKQLCQKFQPGEHITREALYDFYSQFDPGLKTGTLGWRIYDLKKKNIITPIRKGVYALSGKPPFRPGISKKMQKVSNSIKKAFPGVNYNLWTTGWLNEFTLHQAINEMVILEVEKESMPSVFYHLKDKGFKNVFLKPERDLMEKYISEERESIVIKNTISRSPVHTIKKIPVPALEKILVDIFCDAVLLYIFGGNEMINIYNHALDKYSVNIAMMLNYAGRRRRKEPITAFMRENLNSSLAGLIK
ncbi:MAG: hypothetical protein GY940_23565 [bacterium]|nr:hypothetical protein [bacterium]